MLEKETKEYCADLVGVFQKIRGALKTDQLEEYGHLLTHRGEMECEKCQESIVENENEIAERTKHLLEKYIDKFDKQEWPLD